MNFTSVDESMVNQKFCSLQHLNFLHLPLSKKLQHGQDDDDERNYIFENKLPILIHLDKRAARKVNFHNRNGKDICFGLPPSFHLDSPNDKNLKVSKNGHSALRSTMAAMIGSLAKSFLHDTSNVSASIQYSLEITIEARKRIKGDRLASKPQIRKYSIPIDLLDISKTNVVSDGSKGSKFQSPFQNTSVKDTRTTYQAMMSESMNKLTDTNDTLFSRACVVRSVCPGNFQVGMKVPFLIELDFFDDINPIDIVNVEATLYRKIKTTSKEGTMDLQAYETLANVSTFVFSCQDQEFSDANNCFHHNVNKENILKRRTSLRGLLDLRPEEFYDITPTFSFLGLSIEVRLLTR